MDGFELVLDGDADTSITSDTDDRIDFRASGQDLWKMDGTATTPVNGLTFLASAAASPVQIQAHGSDTNIGITAVPKGTGAFTVTATTGTISMTTVTATIAATNIILDAATSVDIDGATFIIDADADSSLRATSDDVVALKLQNVDAFIFDGDVSTPVNGLTFKSQATGVDPTIGGHGTDAIVNVRLDPKSTGVAACAGGWAVDGSSALSWRWTGSGTSILLQENTGSASAPTWTTRTTFATGVGFSQGLTLLGTYSPSAAASVDITSKISATYSAYLIVFALVPATDGAALYLRTDSNNGASFDAGAGDYGYCGSESTTTPAVNTHGSASATQVVLAGAVGNATNENVSGQVLLNFIGSATAYPTFNWDSSQLDTSTALRAYAGGGTRRSAAAIDAVQLLMSSGNLTGVVRIYGIANA